MEQNLLKLTDLSKMLNIAKSTIYNYAKKGDIPYIKIGGKILFSEKAINEWMLANTHNVKTTGASK
jgi:excisionase family DNA binding protein